MGKKEKAPKMEVPSTLKMIVLDLKRSHEIVRRDIDDEPSFARKALGLIETLLWIGIAPAVRRYDRGPGSFRQDMFVGAQVDIESAFEGESPFMGDHWLSRYPEEYATHLLEAVRKGDADPLLDTNVGKITKYILYNLRKREKPDEAANRYFASWLEATIDDYGRMKRREASRDERLQEIYEGKGLGYNVRLVLAGADLRINDLTGCFGRDLEQMMAITGLYKRWEEGRIYVPREVLEEAGVSPDQSVDDVKGLQIIETWRRDTGSDAKRRLKENVYELDHGLEIEDGKCKKDRRAKRCLSGLAIKVIRGEWY